MKQPNYLRSEPGRKPGKKRGPIEKPYSILLRPFPRDLGVTLTRAAQARGMSQSDYVAALVRLHDLLLADARAAARGEKYRVWTETLDELHLGPVNA